MTPTLWLLAGAVAWLALAAPVAVLIGKAIERHCPCDAPDDGDDLLADIPCDCLSADELNVRFRQLTDPIEAERNTRLGGLW